MVNVQLRERGITDPDVLAAFASVPRHEFVAPELAAEAYDDGPLPIGSGQTISQPYVVALTAQALQLRGTERVLDIGTGSGYAAAILGRIAREVITIERIESLAREAEERLRRLGFTNVHVHHADGSLGWPPQAPYDAIAVAAGAPQPPRALLEQLAIGGRLVVPAGEAERQQLIRIVRTDASTFVQHDFGGVRFVPLVGQQGWPTTH